MTVTDRGVTQPGAHPRDQVRALRRQLRPVVHQRARPAQLSAVAPPADAGRPRPALVLLPQVLEPDAPLQGARPVQLRPHPHGRVLLAAGNDSRGSNLQKISFERNTEDTRTRVNSRTMKTSCRKWVAIR